MSSTTGPDSPRFTGLGREIQGRVVLGQPVDPGKAAQLRSRLRATQSQVEGHLTTHRALEPSAQLSRWSGGHGTHGGTAGGSRGATAAVSGVVCVLVHGRERNDGRRRQ